MFGQRNWLDRRGRQSVDSDLFLLRGSSHVHPPAHFLPVVEMAQLLEYFMDSRGI
jgi:hypothetical protein